MTVKVVTSLELVTILNNKKKKTKRVEIREAACNVVSYRKGSKQKQKIGESYVSLTS